MLGFVPNSTLAKDKEHWIGIGIGLRHPPPSPSPTTRTATTTTHPHRKMLLASNAASGYLTTNLATISSDGPGHAASPCRPQRTASTT
jgi:hypothetical protein